MALQSSSMPKAQEGLAYVVGIDRGMESCVMCCLTMDKHQIIKPSSFDNTEQGCSWILTRLEQLECQPQEVLIGLEATSRDAREHLSSLTQAWLPGLFTPSRPGPRLFPTTRLACQNGSPGLWHDCACTVEWGSALWLRSKPKKSLPTEN